MKADEIRSKLRGVIAFPVTPFNSDLSLDAAGLRKNLRALLKHPMSAVVAAGGTGELYSLTPAEQFEVLKTVVEEIKGKTPVIAGVGFNTEIATALAKQS
jgi:5-dehydro-4-deoxyglucarate dehydratase